MIVAAVSRASTCPSINRPASATGMAAGRKATGMGRSGSLATLRRSARQWHRPGRKSGIAPVATVLAPPQGADDRRSDRDAQTGNARRTNQHLLAAGQLRAVRLEVRRIVRHHSGLDLHANGDTLTFGEVLALKVALLDMPASQVWVLWAAPRSS